MEPLRLRWLPGQTKSLLILLSYNVIRLKGEQLYKLSKLRQEDFGIELVEDLGLIFPKEGSKTKQRYGLFKCAQCDIPHKKPIASVKAGSTRCRRCAMTVHGNSRHKLYMTWINEKRRCYDQNHDSYKYYGERGITVSDEFKDFNRWLEHIESLDRCYEEGMTIDRIDNDGNYERGNLRWATLKEQANNKRNTPGRYP